MAASEAVREVEGTHRALLQSESLATAVSFGAAERLTGEVGEGEPVSVRVTRAV